MIIFYIILILNLIYQNLYTKILFLAFFSTLVIIRSVQFNHYYHRNMKRLSEDKDKNYNQQQLKRDGRYFFVFTYLSYLFCMLFIFLIIFATQYSYYIILAAILLIVIAIFIDNKFEKRSNLRELLAEKDKAS